MSKNLPNLKKVLHTENQALLDVYMDEDFPAKMMQYLMSKLNKNKAKM